MPIEASRQEKSPLKPEQSPVRRGRPRKSPSKPKQSSVRRGRSRKSPLKPKQSPVRRGRSRMPIETSRQEKCPSMPKQSSVRKGRPRTYANSSEQEKSVSKLEQSPVRRERSRFSVYRLKKSSSVPEESSAKRKRPIVSVKHFGSEASIIESETSPKEISKVTVENTSISDTQTGGILHAHVYQPFQSLQWLVPPNEVKKPSPYLVAKAFTAETISFGFLDVSPFSTKEAQYSPAYNLHFVVMKGIVDVIIHETKFTFENGDSFIVPVGTPYSVKNCSSARALLSFSTFREPVFPCRIEG
ncbi:CENP-C_C domain-containing protein [Trichonephila clavipes]|nr:CENP-C_C domain-containing protein [Trichonephila clavipes]